MKISTLLIFLLFCCNCIKAQVLKEIQNGISVQFPSNPIYKPSQSARTYVAKTENCIFMAIVQNNAIPSDLYLEMINMNKADFDKAENMLLDNAAKGIYSYANYKGTASNIYYKKYKGRSAFYYAINQLTGNKSKYYSSLFLVKNNVITLTVIYNNDNEISDSEKNDFLNSITFN